MSKKRNIVGPQVRKLRNEKGWTQDQLAAKCGVVGFDISRGTLAQIEAQLRGVSDLETVLLSKALKSDLLSLIPKRLPPWNPSDRTGRNRS